MGSHIKYREWTYIDKAGWGNGKWLQECDKCQWTDEATGLPCLIVRTPHHGALCGYVGVDERHSLYGKEYDAADVEVHGGLTFAGFCQDRDDELGICHIPGEGEPEKVWWLGFDAAHAFDISPAYYGRNKHLRPLPNEQYRDLQYVKEQCRQLAQQLISQETHND